MEWKKVRLGDYISIKSGLAYSGSKIGKGDSILLGMGCVSFKEKFVETGARPYDDYCDERFVVKPGEIVLATRQQSDNLPILAMPAIIPKSFEGKRVIFGTNLYKVENKSEISNRFLFWLLKHQHYFKYIAGVKSGTAVQMVTKKNVEDYKFLCPSKGEREKIADILWSYDNLIENNTRRIRLLEQMAENLYKEWFVRFRFPGYEKAEFENRLPKGWKRGKLRDIAIEVDKPEKAVNRNKYEHYLPIDKLPCKSMALFDEDSIENAESSLIAFKKGDILFNSMRPYFHKVIIAPFDGLTRTTCFVLNAKKQEYRLFLYLSMFQKSTIDWATTVAVGSTMPYDRWNDLARLNVVIPNLETIDNFNHIISPIINRIIVNYTMNQQLTKQRDLLLPRLMSGKLEVKQ